MVLNKRLVTLILGLSVLIFSACSPQPAPSPIPDTGDELTPVVATPTAVTPATDTPVVTTEPPGAEDPLANTQWVLETFGPTGAEEPVVGGSTITLEFDDAGQAGGSAGCNSYGAPYEIQGNTISFGEITSTLIACVEEGVMEQEQRYLQALQTAGRFELSGDRLTIWYDNEQGVLNFVSATSAPTPATPAPTDTAEPTPGQQGTVAPPPVNESGVLSSDHFNIGTVAGVAESWFVSTVSGVPYGPEGPPPLRGWPPHLFVTFEEEGRPEADEEIFTHTAPQGRVFPVEAYREMSDQAGNEFVGQWIDDLQTILEERPQTFENPIPVLPDVGATQDFRGKVSYIDFTGGSGIGFIGHHGQDLGPFTDESIAYFFQGLTDDGKHYLSFVQPLSTNFLPETFTEVPQETMDALNTDPQGYLQEVSQMIEEADNSDFTPNLDALVAMYGSIVIGPQTGGTPAAGTPAAGTPSAGTPASTPGTGGTGTGTSPAPGITGFLWTWERLRGAGSSNVTVTEPLSYTLSLLPNGSIAVDADCNQASGRYNLGSGGSISITLSGNRKDCDDESLSEQYLDLLEEVATYDLSGSSLTLNLEQDGGQMIFTVGQREISVTEEPEAGAATVTTTEPLNILSGPGSQYPSYGKVEAGTVLEVVGQSQDGAWWVVKLPPSIVANGQGWVSGRYVEPENTEDVPVIQPPAP